MKTRFTLPLFRRLATLLCCAALAQVVGPTPRSAATSPYFITHASTGDSAARLVRLTDATAASVQVSQKNKTFEPAALDIRVGQTVAILNDDSTVHNAFCSAGDFKYNSGPQKPGSQSTLSFTAPGTYLVRCAIHPKMLLTVKVSE